MSSNFNPQFAKLGEILINNGKVTESGINEALAQQKTTNDKIENINTAKKLGFKTIHLYKPELLTNEIKKYI